MTIKARGLELVELPVQSARGERPELPAAVCVRTDHIVRDATEVQKLAKNVSN